MDTIEVRLIKKGELTGRVVAKVEFSAENREAKIKEAIAICDHWYNAALPSQQKNNDFLVISKDGSVIYYKAGPKE